MIDRRLLAQIDLLALAVTMALALAGLAVIYSATYLHMPSVYVKETYWIALGVVFLLLAVAVNYTFLEQFAYVLYGLVMVLLVAVLFVGSSGGGAQRWLSLGYFTLQPSEVAKLALIIVLAKHFSSSQVRPLGLGIKDLLTPAGLLAIPFLLIAKQPDLGTAIILWMIFWSMVLTVKVRLRTVAGIVIAFSAMIPLGWTMLKGYQKARILSFWDPTTDPLGSGYHVMQSKIAIGSGGLLGKGFTEGTQGKLMFLPEQHTDFAFAVLAEEWGLIGVLILIGLFTTLLLSGLNTAGGSKDRFGFLVAVGVTSMFFWHVVINLGMVSGLLPVVGVPLPFISYGGSFLITSMTACGLLINIRMRRFIF
ncbi:MAG: rod shape-determining protein RodA [Thermodesulfobacteriota bacterium]